MIRDMGKHSEWTTSLKKSCLSKHSWGTFVCRPKLSFACMCRGMHFMTPQLKRSTPTDQAGSILPGSCNQKPNLFRQEMQGVATHLCRVVSQAQ
mmetsp:Transcript_67186/g.112738  ORF Transcript_67186/g.112738 Transcript_67186/m.112738 type:complete len:94 (-) Transcript_67186:3673-3954(-)